MTRPSDTEAVTMPTTPGSVIEAKPRGRKKAFLMALCDDGEWWVRLDNYGSFSERGPFREVRILFDAGNARLAGAGAQVTEAAVEAAAEAMVHLRWPAEPIFPGDREVACAALSAALPHMGTGQSEADLRARLEAAEDRAEAQAQAQALEEAAYVLREEWVKYGHHYGEPGHYSTGYEKWLIDRAKRIRLLDRPAAAEGNET